MKLIKFLWQFLKGKNLLVTEVWEDYLEADTIQQPILSQFKAELFGWECIDQVLLVWSKSHKFFECEKLKYIN